MGDFFYGLAKTTWALFMTLIFGDAKTNTNGIIGNDPETWLGSDGYAGIMRLNDVLVIIGSALVSIFCMYNLIKKFADIKDLKRPENIITFIMQFAVCQTVVVYNKVIINGIFDLGKGLFDLLDTHGTSILGTSSNPSALLPDMNPLDTAFEGWVGLVDLLKTVILQLVNFFIYGGFFLVVAACGIIIILTLFTRHVKLVMHIVTAPLALSSFAGTREMHHTGISWIRSFCGLCLQEFLILLTFFVTAVMSSHLLNTGGMDLSEMVVSHVPSDLLDGVVSLFGQDFLAFMTQMIQLVVCGIKLAIISFSVKSTDKLTAKLFGL